MKNFLEKDKTIGVDLMIGLLKYWPITCPAKEVVYINELEEIMEYIGIESEKRLPYPIEKVWETGSAGL